jgi:hypothetical protein
MYELEILKMELIKECTKVNAIKTATNILKNDYTINIEDQYKITDKIKSKLITLYINKNKLKGW